MLESSHLHRISEGNTNNYLIPGVLIVIVGVILLAVGFNSIHFWLIFPAILLFLIAIALFIGANGLEIDTKQRRYRKFGKFGPIIIGSWEKLPPVKLVRVQVHAESGANTMQMMMPARVATANTKVTTFDLVVFSGQQKGVILYSFLKYKAARSGMQVLVEAFNAEAEDLIAQKIAENRSRRR